MATDCTRLIVRKTVEQLRGEWQGNTPVPPLEFLDSFEKRLDFNLNLAGIAQVTGRKPKAKSEPRRANIPPHAAD